MRVGNVTSDFKVTRYPYIKLCEKNFKNQRSKKNYFMI